MTCPVHGIEDGYQPAQPEGTMLRALEDLDHACEVFMCELRRPLMTFLKVLAKWARSHGKGKDGTHP